MSSFLCFTGIGTGVEYSDCKRYKYVEYHRTKQSGRSVMFVLLNPTDDYRERANIKRCLDYAAFWGFGEVYITYLFAYRTAYFQQLSRASHNKIDIVGPENNLEGIGREVDMVVFAWGPYGRIADRDKKIIELFRDTGHYIELSVIGYPREPETLKRQMLPRKYHSADVIY